MSTHPQPSSPESRPEPVDDRVRRLASRFESVSSLQSAAIHDFRGSLNALGLSVRLLEEVLKDAGEGQQPEVQRRCLISLKDELRRLERATGRVLEAGRPDEPVPHLFGLRGILDEVSCLLRPTAERQHVTIEIDAPGDLEVVCRPSSIRHAVLNLAGNALQAMSGGGALRLGLRAEGDRALITVSDTGPGIPNEVCQRMWDVYYSTRQGTGIGLPVTARIVEAHGGALALEPSDAGASFAIRLPLPG